MDQDELVCIVVESLALAGVEPPPETLTWFTCGELAFEATFTVTVIAGKLDPAVSTLLVVHVFVAQVHPVPAIDTNVSPEGTVSVTVTVPLVGPAPAAFDTVTVYVAFCCPCVKFPECVLVMLSAGIRMIMVESVALAVAEPPPETLTWFTCGELAFEATFTVTVIAG